MRAAEVRLRPFTESDLHYFDEPVSADLDPFNFFGWRPASAARRGFAQNGLIGPDRATLAVEVAGEVVGDIGWHEVHHGPPAAGATLNIGITLRPEQRGKGYGTAAQRLLAEYLFRSYAINRIEAETDAENLAEQRALERAGFTREGMLRGAAWRAGRWHDMVLYSRLRGD